MPRRARSKPLLGSAALLAKYYFREDVPLEGPLALLRQNKPRRSTVRARPKSELQWECSRN